MAAAAAAAHRALDIPEKMRWTLGGRDPDVEYPAGRPVETPHQSAATRDASGAGLPAGGFPVRPERLGRGAGAGSS
eukprot:6061369-Pyramimonas_sp.AAC.1